jgi:hypothetical protein
MREGERDREREMEKEEERGRETERDRERRRERERAEKERVVSFSTFFIPPNISRDFCSPSYDLPLVRSLIP